MSQALYRKWRPRLWEQVIGQEHIVQTLQNAIKGGRVAHAYLFAGPRGTGKTTTARLLAKAVNCLDPHPGQRPCDRCEHCLAVNESRFLDLIEIDAASNTSVDDVRDLRDKINFSPSQGEFKVYIIDEVHMLSTAAFNALLKTLEEPPAHAIFILATTEVHKIPATVLSRCQRHEFRRIPVADIVHVLREMADAEKVEVDDEALVMIARQSTGSMRDAISLLDQLASTGQHITLATAQTVLGTATSQLVFGLVDALQSRQAADGLAVVHRALDGGTDPRQFARQVVEYLRALLLIRMGSGDQVEATPEQRAQMGVHASGMETGWIMESIRAFNAAAAETRGGWQPSLGLELALVESIQPRPAALPAGSAVAPPAQPPGQVPAPVRPPVPEPSEVYQEPVATPGPLKPASKKPAAQPTSASVPPVVEPETAPPAPAGHGGVSLQTVLSNWSQIRATIKKSRSQTEGLLNSCKPVSLKDGLLTLGFASELLKSKMETRENLDITCQVISQVCGGPVQIACVVLGIKTGGSSGDLGSEGDGMVGTALNLGGTIVHKK
jgi:DNA polymerase-3 subunit gamma/tau